MAAKSFVWSIRLSFNSILISNTEFEFLFFLWFHQNKHTSKTEITVLIIQAQNFCSRKSCHYIEEASLQKKNNILINIEMQICLLPKPTFLSWDWLEKESGRFDFKEDLTTSSPLPCGRDMGMAGL